MVVSLAPFVCPCWGMVPVEAALSRTAACFAKRSIFFLWFPWREVAFDIDGVAVSGSLCLMEAHSRYLGFSNAGSRG